MPQRVVRIKVRKRLLGKYVWKILERACRIANISREIFFILT